MATQAMARIRAACLALLGAAGLAAGYAYLPPLGTRVDLPYLVPLLAPQVAHTEPVFIRTGEHVYYRTRLERIVGPSFTESYYEQLRERGVQFDALVLGTFSPVRRMRTFEIGFVREKEVRPYTIEYWKSVDRTVSWPITLRWPWLNVRLAATVLESKSHVVLPDADVVRLDLGVLRMPGSAVLAAKVSENTMHRDRSFLVVDAVVPGGQKEILAYYEAILRAYSASVHRSDNLSAEIGRAPLPAPLSGVTSVQVSVSGMLFADLPVLVTAPPWRETRGLRNLLPHLPDAARFEVSLTFSDPDAAQAILAAMPQMVP
jgi:hypothetical protein